MDSRSPDATSVTNGDQNLSENSFSDEREPLLRRPTSSGSSSRGPTLTANVGQTATSSNHVNDLLSPELRPVHHGYTRLPTATSVRPDSPGQGNSSDRQPSSSSHTSSNSTNAELLQVLRQLLPQHSPRPPNISTSSSTNSMDSEMVTAKDQLSNLIRQDCPKDLSGRRTWLKTIHVNLINNSSGVRWIENRSIVAAF